MERFEPMGLPLMTTSPEIALFAGALAKAQGSFGNAEKSRKNSQLQGAKFSTLADIVEVIREPMSANGLSYIQPTSCDGKMVTIFTLIMHESGQWIGCVWSFPVPDMKGIQPVQAAGIVTTYGKKYSLSSMLGIVSDEDTDGQPPINRSSQSFNTREESPVSTQDKTFNSILQTVQGRMKSAGIEVDWQDFCTALLGGPEPPNWTTPMIQAVLKESPDAWSAAYAKLTAKPAAVAVVEPASETRSSEVAFRDFKGYAGLYGGELNFGKLTKETRTAWISRLAGDANIAKWGLPSSEWLAEQWDYCAAPLQAFSELVSPDATLNHATISQMYLTAMSEDAPPTLLEFTRDHWNALINAYRSVEG